jgi:hypothetical protein
MLVSQSQAERTGAAVLLLLLPLLLLLLLQLRNKCMALQQQTRGVVSEWTDPPTHQPTPCLYSLGFFLGYPLMSRSAASGMRAKNLQEQQ